jgi:PAS domain-containing protein
MRKTPFDHRREGIIRRFSVATLNQARLEDLHRLMDLRGWDRLPPGNRDSWMLIAASSLSRLVEKPEFLEREVFALAAEVAGWSRSETKSRMQQVFARARAAASGGKVLWDGEWKDPRYNFTNQRIIEMLDITPEEETELRTIISDHSRLHRDRVRKERQRRAQGVQPRGEYLAEAKKKRRLARQMQRRGVSTAEIARRLECTPRHVSRLIK